ncbi:putative NBD/HSP70 family sugar kinase [Motilibacter peucedani]|uniref:Putative NBD/HSP70 family sugar kinase n=1 Tax=Motilibacter peucedani TaxID=598650 RepID=A0A420XRJ2_9ACTN|nr:ROK family transcriptional regulator [Motilibacter peucedani]RKS77523.1 putative NBD/HSP70 family sugar kinase [Motilibacter peucedani]
MREGTARRDPLRAANRRRVLEALARLGSGTNADLCRETHLSRATVTSVVAELRDDGLVRSVDGPRTGTRGRPAGRLALAPPPGLTAVVEVAVGSLRVALGTLEPRVRAERVVRVDTRSSGTAALEVAARTVRELQVEVGAKDLSRVVLGVPGPLDPRTGVVRSGVLLPGWADLDPVARLGGLLGVPVTADNDANLVALGEATYGAGAGHRDLVVVDLCDGIGAGLVLDGRLHRGTSGIAGEIGHVQVVHEGGRPCRCGSTGCLETVASAPQVLAALSDELGSPADLELLASLAAEGSTAAQRILRTAGLAVGRVLAPVCATLDLGAVVTGGAVGGLGTALQEGVAEAVDRRGSARAVEVLRGRLGTRAGVLGGFALAAQEQGHVLRPRPLIA